MNFDLSKIFSGIIGGLFDSITDAPDKGAAQSPDAAGPDFKSAIKLIHADALRELPAFPRYQEFDGVRYDEYVREHDRLRELRRIHSDAIAAVRKSVELDSETPVSYHSFHVEVAPSIWTTVRKIALPPPEHEQTTATASEGEIRDGNLLVKAGWFKKKVRVSYACPTRIRHREELASLRRKISDLSPLQQQALNETTASRFGQPVLFISHRWESQEHPDPENLQLAKLRRLQNCFIIYDYSSFPQKPLSQSDAEDLELILKNMGEIIRNVVILDHPGYVRRGWCLYEYIASCLGGSTVCDEIQDPRFVSLRNWTATRAPASPNPWRDGGEALMSNHKQVSLLSAVNEILPSYKEAEFTVHEDRPLVRGLLTSLLKKKLPPKRSYQPETFIYESSSSLWSDEELQNAFEDRLTWPELGTIPMDPFRVEVPASISEAVKQRYKVTTVEPAGHAILEMGSPIAELRKALRKQREDND
jgi:hypothetical protein